MVVTASDCDDLSIGKDHWMVYPGTARGFGDAQKWSLPDTALDANVHPWGDTVGDNAYQSCGGLDSVWYYLLMDINGDGAADLVKTRADCDDDAVGKKSWAVHLGECK